MTEDETVCSIKEALEVVREWNPDWSPHLFMTDNCSQEIQAIENLFLECKVLLCDFHREQAWERWASKTANGVVAHKEELLALLRRTAHASTREEFESAVTVLENFHVWKSNKALRHWFQDTWLAERERWVWAFRQDRLQVAVNTNDGLERQNEDFKYNHLANHRDKSLSGMLSVLITDFFTRKVLKVHGKKSQVSQNVQNIQQTVTGIPRQQAKIFCGALHRMLPNLMKQQPHQNDNL